MITKPEHETAYQDIAKLVGKHADKLTALELLAVAANFVGKLVAMQDQRSVTPKMAMTIVEKNMLLGNQQVIAMINETKGNA